MINKLKSILKRIRQKPVDHFHGKHIGGRRAMIAHIKIASRVGGRFS